MNGITFNNKHSFNDFQLIFNSKKISTPSKKKIKESVPGMNSVYDFSTVASGGEIIYDQREIECNFTLLANSKNELHIEMSKTAEWLQDAPQSQLIFDDISDYYFMAELEDEIEINEEQNIAEISVTFVAEPFRKGVNLVGSEAWDLFNFEEDIMQDVEFNVVVTESVTIYNPGRSVMPVVNCDAEDMSITYHSTTYNLAVGDNELYNLKLASGSNDITVNGTGNIKFIYRKESL